MKPEQWTVMAAFFNNVRPGCPLFESSQSLENEFLMQLARLPYSGSVDADYPGQMVASFVNKSKTALAEVVDTMVKGIFSGSLVSLSHGIWLTKALVMRGDAKGYELTEHLLDCLRSESKELATMASEGFSTIVSENPDVLWKDCFAVQKVRLDVSVIIAANVLFNVVLPLRQLLYRQRFFHEIIPRLESRFQKAQEGVFSVVMIFYLLTAVENKHFYLVALSHILRHTPKKVLLGEVKSVSLLLADPSDLTSLAHARYIAPPTSIPLVHLHQPDHAPEHFGHLSNPPARCSSTARWPRRLPHQILAESIAAERVHGKPPRTCTTLIFHTTSIAAHSQSSTAGPHPGCNATVRCTVSASSESHAISPQDVG